MFITRKIDSKEYKFFVHYLTMQNAIASLIEDNFLKTYYFPAINLPGLLRRRYINPDGKITQTFFQKLRSIISPNNKNTIINLKKEEEYFKTTKIQEDYDISNLIREKDFAIKINTKNNNSIYVEFDSIEKMFFIESHDYSQNFKTFNDLIIKLYQSDLIVSSDRVILDLKYKNVIESVSETGGILFIRKLFELIVKNKYNMVLNNKTGGVL